MEKQFRLPKEFAEKWLTALRSGEYVQGEENLLIVDENECRYCCLGVAGKIAGFDNEILKEHAMLEEFEFKSSEFLPKELLETIFKKKDSLIYILTLLNDGLYKSGYDDKIKDKNLIFRELNPYNHDFDILNSIKFNFNQIADFIEDNCEFYDAVEQIKN